MDKRTTLKEKASNLIWLLDDNPHHDQRRARARSTERYSKTVFWLKVALPALALALLMLLIIWPMISANESKFRLANIESDVLENHELKMVNPRFIGLDNANQPFSIAAKNAIQTDSEGNEVRFEQINADISLDSGSWIALLSGEGLFVREDNILMLEKGVNVFHDNGYEINTSEARLDFKDNEIIGRHTVKGSGPIGNLQAQGFRVVIDEDKLYLLGKTKITIFPSG